MVQTNFWFLFFNTILTRRSFIPKEPGWQQNVKVPDLITKIGNALLKLIHNLAKRPKYQ